MFSSIAGHRKKLLLLLLLKPLGAFAKGAVSDLNSIVSPNELHLVVLPCIGMLFTGLECSDTAMVSPLNKVVLRLVPQPVPATLIGLDW